MVKPWPRRAMEEGRPTVKDTCHKRRLSPPMQTTAAVIALVGMATVTKTVPFVDCMTAGGGTILMRMPWSSATKVVAVFWDFFLYPSPHGIVGYMQTGLRRLLAPVPNTLRTCLVRPMA